MLIGIVGKPNVGKSTFFKALTLAEVAIAPYPFTTLEKNEGVAFVKTTCPETELKLRCNPRHGFCINGERFVPVKLIDVAGLVPGAHLGKGRGNKFLDDLREADVLIHVLDASGTTDAEGKPTSNFDPCFDVRFLQEEIEMWMYAIVSENWQGFVKKALAEKKRFGEEIARKLSGLKISQEAVELAMKKLKLDVGIWTQQQLMEFVRELRKLSKPIIVAANKADMPRAAENIKKLREEFPNLLIIPCSAECELALREAARDKIIEYVAGNSEFNVLDDTKITEEQKKALLFIRGYLQKNKNTGIQQCINIAVYDYLRYITVYPVENEQHFSDSKGNVLPDAFLLPQGSTALDLAYAIHTDIGKAFVAAIDARTKKRLAKDYILKDRDIIKILT